MTSQYVVMQNDTPIAVMRERCSRKFHSFVLAHASKNDIKLVPPFKANSTIYQCTGLQDQPVYYIQTEVQFIN